LHGATGVALLCFPPVWKEVDGVLRGRSEQNKQAKQSIKQTSKQMKVVQGKNNINQQIKVVQG
jgi:hypothetical protein